MRPGSSPGPPLSYLRNGNGPVVTPVVRRMKIAVIGTGRIGGSLGTKWVAAGYDVVYGSRTGSGTGPGGAPVLAVSDALEGEDLADDRGDRARRGLRQGLLGVALEHVRRHLHGLDAGDGAAVAAGGVPVDLGEPPA